MHTSIEREPFGARSGEANFTGLDNETTCLNLSHKKLHELSQKVLELTKLISLNLTENELQKLPLEISRLTNLTILDLSENPLQELSQLVRLTNLKTLRIAISPWGKLFKSDIIFRQLPKEIECLINLEKLDLQGHILEQLPDEIGMLTKLTSLNLWSTRFLRQLPIEVGCLINLTELNLYCNKLQHLPMSIGRLTNLKLLNLEYNNLQQLPPEIGALSNLTNLNLKDNKELIGLPIEIFQIPNRCQVELTGCGFSQHVIGRIRDVISNLNYQGPRFSYSVYENRPTDERSTEVLLYELYQFLGRMPPELNLLLNDINLEKDLQQWLSRLSYTSDYQNGKTSKIGFVKKIVSYLELAQMDSLFRESFAAIIKGSSETCGDRITLSILHVGIAYRLTKMDLKDMPVLGEFLINTLWGLDLLDGIARDKIPTLHLFDEIEVYLGYPVQLKERLGLQIDVEGMLYFGCSALTNKDLNDAAEFVLSQRNNENVKLKFLIEHDVWKKALRKNYPEECLKLDHMRYNMVEYTSSTWEQIQEADTNGWMDLTRKVLGLK